MAKRKHIDIVSLGCSKNLIDSERLARRLHDCGIAVRFDPEEADGRADAVIINTCGFIGDAKEESINTILEWVSAKERGLVGEVHVMGCLSERYRSVLPTEIPEVDSWRGKRDWESLLGEFSRRHPATVPYDRVITTPRHHAYLKIAEGCNRHCAFCAIPLITGRYTSRPPQELVEEARMLTGRGVTEINVIAQDLSAYGSDLPGKPGLADLVRRLSDVEGVRRLRLHYAYPAGFPLDVLDVMAERDNVCSYIDIALQHIADPVLTAMRRRITADETRRLLATMRERVPGLHIRTTLMVGFPGEGEREYAQLLDFVEEQRFERMGAFAYCEEEDTHAAKTLPDTIPAQEKQRRLDLLMERQEAISLELQQRKVGQTLEVVVDREEQDWYVGRTEWDSPEVDPEVLIEKTSTLKPGQYTKVEITGAMPFELTARPAAPADTHTH